MSPLPAWYLFQFHTGQCRPDPAAWPVQAQPPPVVEFERRFALGGCVRQGRFNKSQWVAAIVAVARLHAPPWLHHRIAVRVRGAHRDRDVRLSRDRTGVDLDRVVEKTPQSPTVSPSRSGSTSSARPWRGRASTGRW